jgi:TRAP-type C4-dicarboxylate transport system substrate-binding protein
VKIKLATIVPKGTSWANTLKAFSKEVKKETNKKVKIQIYYGGVQGDEPDVLRKTRIGQLHGAIFTGKTLGDIFPDIRSIEIPFNYYHDEQKAVDAIESQKKYFDQNLAKKGFVNLGFYSIGKVYVVSTKEVRSITDLKGIKMWAWEGDKVVQAMIKSLGLVSVPLALPDVLSSLSTGMIEAAYAPPLGILALQWQSKIKYLIDFPTAYTIGALLISQKKWGKISVENQVIIKKLATKHINKANDLAVEDNKKALLQLKNLGVKFVKFPKQDIAKAEKIRKNVIKLLEGPVLSSKAIKAVELGR